MNKEQDGFEFGEHSAGTGPVECLGMTFASEEARREHFLQLLAEKLKEPEFRATSGFPHTSDEDILRLSDPPYYTACPNPFFGDVVEATRSGQDGDSAVTLEPYVADVSVGKNDPIYNAHSYHTKVSHLAIQQYIEHYTRPGETVLDPFCGTGMTGVACAEISQPRIALLCDLSPAAANIAYNYSAQKDKLEAEAALRHAVDDLLKRFGWMYETRHTGWPSADRRPRRLQDKNPGDGNETGSIEFVVWSDVFYCSQCGTELVFWDAAASFEDAGIKDLFKCPGCHADVGKRDLERAWQSIPDPALKQPMKLVKRVPVLIQYRVGKKTFHKVPDDDDVALIGATDANNIDDWFPTDELHDGDKTSDPKSVGIAAAHHFYTRRNLAVLAHMWRSAGDAPLSVRPALQFLFTSTMVWATRMNRLLVSNFFKKRGGVIGQTLSGTLYVSSVSIETNPIYRFSLREKSAARTASSRGVFVSTQSATSLKSIPSDSIDYVFTDPPFGHNLVYSDLNFLWEGWLGIKTNSEQEAIVSRAQKKTLNEYAALMEQAFREVFRVLRPGRWVTVEFHNSRNTVWRAIQQALGAAGLVVANVSVLHKTHGTFNQVTAAGAVSQDLAISAYKPSMDLEGTLAVAEGRPETAWKFVREHMSNLPVLADGSAAVILERTPQLLLDRMIAFHVQRGVAVPISGPDFIRELGQRFVERDGMYFLSDQVVEYDRRRITANELRQLDLFVTDEASAAQWLRQQLQRKPQTFQELQPQFMQQLQAWSKHEKTVELKEILELNFLRYDGQGPVPGQIHGYLSSNFKELRKLGKDDASLVAKAKGRWYVPDPNKEGDLEKLRTRTMLKEFEEYKASTQRKLKQLRTEALRVGFKAAYDEGDYQTIISVASKIPENVLQEDEKLLMYYDVATMRLGEDG